MAAGRRTSLASLAGAKVDDVPGMSDLLLLSLPIDKLIPTRFNPRRRFGSEQDLREFGEKLAKKQLQPAVVVSRAGYLRLWPDEAERVGSIPYVIANGERRYRASLIVGRPTIDVVHNEDVAKSRADFLDAVQSENNDRENLDPIERAIAIETMVTELGGADKVAAYYGKSKGWVSQQRKLLKLTRELQDLVSAGDMPVRVARDIAGLPLSDQAAAWRAEVEDRAAAKAAPRATRVPLRQPEPAVQEETPDPQRFTTVNQNANGGELESSPEGEAAPSPDASGEAASDPQLSELKPVRQEEGIPEPRHDEGEAGARTSGDSRTPKTLPYDDGNFIAQHLIRKMPAGELVKMLRLLNEHAAQEGLEAVAGATA